MICLFVIFRGFLKNRPALGERALQELLADNLIKYNYFLTDIRNRNLKSYLKLPIPSNNESAQKQFLSNLVKHDIDIDEYRSVYQKSSIPPNNKLSTLSLQLFETNASFVSQYSKYKNQLQVIIKKHIDNHNIKETEERTFIVTNNHAFPHQYHDIRNLMLSERQERQNNISHLHNLTRPTTVEQTTDSRIELENTNGVPPRILCDLHGNIAHMNQYASKESSTVPKDAEIIKGIFFLLLISYIYILAIEKYPHKQTELTIDIENSLIRLDGKETVLEESLDDNINNDNDTERFTVSTGQSLKESMFFFVILCTYTPYLSFLF